MLIILGTTDEVNTCDCCGRTDLKDTVALQDDETGDIVYYGCVCAAKKRNVPAKQIKSEAKKADEAKAKAARAERNRLDKIEDDKFQSFLDGKTVGMTFSGNYYGQTSPSINRFSQIQALGGWVTARAMYKAENNG